ncbi:hypothetical protein FHX57_006764 [Paraburkholderia tropica]|uniref:hypothetical protein n=1 Tax=Paraburkholderia tropica TaxID=92647 RepID=UPI0016094B1A|nr:hypothetical protein [Paraburkholderia tropica]MBB3004382.1 hypothetical protein [Paraburkholderia tropica]
MARSATFSGSFGGDPLANLERSRAEASGKTPTKRERLEMGNRPLSESGRRTPDEGEKPAHKTFEAFLGEEIAPKKRSEAWKRLESIFSKA